jgi:hypothetical protein
LPEVSRERSDQKCLAKHTVSLSCGFAAHFSQNLRTLKC